MAKQIASVESEYRRLSLSLATEIDKVEDGNSNFYFEEVLSVTKPVKNYDACSSKVKPQYKARLARLDSVLK